jgi:hypothetical protein
LLPRSKKYCVLDFSYYLFRDRRPDADPNEFILPKELVVIITHSNHQIQHVFHSPSWYSYFVDKDCHWMNENVYQTLRVGIPMRIGTAPFDNVYNIIREVVFNNQIDHVYVYGNKKSQFVENVLNHSDAKVVNIKHWVDMLELRRRVISVQRMYNQSVNRTKENIQKQFCSKLPFECCEPCGIVNDFSNIASNAFCEYHTVGSVATCMLKRATLFASYIKSVHRVP